MIVFINKRLSQFSTPWTVKSSRVLLIHNNTAKFGRRFENVYLTYVKDGRIYRISMFPHANKNPLNQKVCGIWVADTDYEVIGKETFSGKTKRGMSIDGKFGIYEVGTKILENGITWILKEDRGWVVYHKED